MNLTLLDAVDVLAAKMIGAPVVIDDRGTLVGIISRQQRAGSSGGAGNDEMRS